MNRTLLILLVGALCLSLDAQQKLGDGIKELATQITASATRQEKQRIAVLPFHELDEQPTVLGTYLAEELVTNLFQLGNFKIVERQLLDKVLGELRIEQSGAIDPRTAKEIGRIVAVDAIVTGSITDLESYIAVNCRLIDTTTGEVFGAAQTKILKDDDVRAIMKYVRTSAAPSVGRHAPATAALGTKDIGSLRITLKSVDTMSTYDRTGRSAKGIRCTFSFTNREARKELVVAMNAQSRKGSAASGVQIVTQKVPESALLRTSLLDEAGGTWSMSEADVTGVGTVRAGVHGRDGMEAYSATEVVRLLRLRDELGRNTDDPADGITANATSMGSGGYNYTYGSGGNTSPARFFAFTGNAFITGSTTTIEPGTTIDVTMSFHEDSRARYGSAPKYFQLSSEIVVGVSGSRDRVSYSLQNLTLHRVNMPTF